MKVRDVLKRLQEDGWRLVERKAVTDNSIILPNLERLPSLAIRQ